MSVLGHFFRRSGILLHRTCISHPEALLGVKHVECSTSSTEASKGQELQEGAVKMSKSMQAYQERAQAHDKFMADQIAEYEIGKRHLANMMGEDPETFTQEDVDAAISYLLPSGLFEPRARPAMKHPDQVFTKRKAAEFDVSGRPFHTLFYTGMPMYYQALHDLSKLMISLDHFKDRLTKYQVERDTDQAFNPGGSEWVSKEQLEEIFLERLHEKHYTFFIRSLTRLVEHPYSSRAQDFIMRFRKVVVSAQKQQQIPELMFTAEGIPYMSAEGKRKLTLAKATVYGRGSGKININGKDIKIFSNIQDREQIVFPLQFTGLLGKVDIVAESTGDGSSAMAGAIRYAISQALRSFVDEEMREKMRLAGLLTRDPRRRERKKPGQKGARAKYTWKKR